MRTLDTLFNEMTLKGFTHDVFEYKGVRDNKDNPSKWTKKSFFSYCHEGSITVDAANESWTFTGSGNMNGFSITHSYKDIYVVFCKNYTECQKFENNSGKFPTLICVDVETKRVYSCSKNNNGIVSLVRLYKSPFKRGGLLDANVRADYLYVSTLAEGEVAYDYTS